jgi:hypothetical protein
MHPDLERPREPGSRLRELADESVMPYDWREFCRRAEQRARRPAVLARGWAVAAIAVTALAAIALWAHLDAPERQEALTAAAEVQAPPPPGSSGAAAERWLASLPGEPAVVRVGTRAAVIRLEDRIAQVDDLLTVGEVGQAQPAQLSALQQERTRLVGALAQVRYAETLADRLR